MKQTKHELLVWDNPEGKFHFKRHSKNSMALKQLSKKHLKSYKIKK